MKKITYIIILLIAATTAAKAQQGFGTSTPAPSSVIDMKAANKGVLLPRVTLTGLTDMTTIPSAASALTVFNTATTTVGDGNDVTPGYYYWDGTKWVRLLTSVDAAVNIYNADGTISEDRTVTMTGDDAALSLVGAGTTAGRYISFRGAGQTIASDTDPAVPATSRLDAGGSLLDMIVYKNNSAAITSGSPGNPLPLIITTKGNSLMRFDTNDIQRAVITEGGNVGIGTANPTSILQVNGSVAAAIKVVNSSYTLTDKDYTLILSGIAEANTITVTFPKASTCPGRIYVVVNNTAEVSESSSISTQMFSSFDGTTAELKYASGDAAATATLQTILTTSGSPINIPITNQRTVWQSDGNNTWWLISL